MDEGAEYDVGEEAFGTMTTPDVLFAADITTAENVEITFIPAEEHGNLQFRQWAQEAEIIQPAEFRRPIPDIAAEVVFEFEALGILMVDVGVGHSGLVGTVFIGECNVGNPAELSSEKGVEGEHRTERSVPVEETLGIEIEKEWVDGAVDDKNIIDRETGRLDATKGGTARVHNEGDYPLDLCGFEDFEADNRVLTPSDRKEKLIVLDKWGGGRTGVFRCCVGHLQCEESVRGVGDAVNIEKLTQAVPIELAPKGALFVVEVAARDFDEGGTGGFPVADEFNHPNVEHEVIQEMAGLVEGEEWP